MTRLRALLPLAVVAGVAVGAAGAAVLPRAPEASGRSSAATATTTALKPAAGAPPAPVRVAPARAPAVPPDVELRVRGRTPAIEARTPDPGGGPPWAVRVFAADRVTVRAARRPGVDPRIGSARCAQLGRIVEGRFGWVDQEAIWRPVGIGYDGAPLACGSATASARQVAADAVTSLRIPPSSPGDARLVRMAVWGLAPERTAVTLAVRGRPAATATGRRGGFLALLDPGTRRRDLRLRARRDGRGLRVAGLALSGGPRAGGDARLIARAPDPAGGLPYGLLVSRDSRGLCTISGPRVVGDRTGGVDLVLGTFTEQAHGGSGCAERGPTRERPLQVGYTLGGGAGEPQEEAERRGRIERRILPGRTIVSGIAHPAVRSVTIATPRDVRTLAPSGPERGFIAVYDGGFPAGEIVLTARMDDGTTQTERFQDAGL